jgi:dihydropteroate synthase
VALMGICNVTPDSFSDGGRFLALEAACARVDELIAEGADIVDIGGESTRPGAEAVPAKEQIARVLEVVRYAAAKTCVSIDTQDPEVAAACLDAGAQVVNDVSCLRDAELGRVTASHGAALVLMHARGTQTDMLGFSVYPPRAYGDVVADVLAEWRAAADRSGLPREALVMDPGLGFAKNARHSAEILQRLPEMIAALDVPVLIGASNKSFLTLVDEGARPQDRTGASIMTAVHAARCGAALLRVHDVRATGQAIDWSLLLKGGT